MDFRRAFLHLTETSEHVASIQNYYMYTQLQLP